MHSPVGTPPVQLPQLHQAALMTLKAAKLVLQTSVLRPLGTTPMQVLHAPASPGRVNNPPAVKPMLQTTMH